MVLLRQRERTPPIYGFLVLASANSISEVVSDFFRLAQGPMAVGIQMIRHLIVHATSVA